MEEIKVGEYIRTIDGKIDKIIEIANNYVLLKSKIIISEYGESHTFIKKSNIVKHSTNIIDLIEEGDYVDGYRVIKKLNNSLLYTNSIEELMLYNSFAPNGVQHYQPILITEDEIKSIVTKEMMKSVEYIIEED